jgi:hypothetical protein
MTKPAMMLMWRNERPQPIERHIAAKIIRGNRRAAPELRIVVQRKHRETYITSTFLNAGCCIHRADK